MRDIKSFLSAKKRIDLNQLLNETMDHPLIMEFSGHNPDVPFEEYKKSLSLPGSALLGQP
jgi:hypothetical protein